MPCLYRKAIYTTQKRFGGSDQAGEQVAEEISAAGDEEVDVFVRAVEVGEGRCGRIWPEHFSLQRTDKKMLKYQMKNLQNLGRLCVHTEPFSQDTISVL